MDPHVKSLWTEALRSGEYKQAEGWLRTPKGYCCLGVLCDIYRKETGLGEWVFDEVRGDRHYRFHIQKTDEDLKTYLPSSVSRWAGLETLEFPEDPTVCGARLSEQNDDGLSFNDIARMIEEGL